MGDPCGEAFEACPVGMLEAELPSGLLSRANAALARALGRPAEALRGRPFADLILRDDRSRWAACLERMVQRDGTAQQLEARMLRADGRCVWMLVVVQPLQGRGGPPDRLMAAVVDLQERKRTEQLLADSESRLRTAMEAAKLGLWEWSLPDDEFSISDEARRLLELAPGQRVDDLGQLHANVHPDDIEAVWSCDAAVRAGRDFQGDFRVLSLQGRLRWVSNHATTEHDTLGRPCRVVGVMADITARKEAEQALRLGRDELEGLVLERTETLMVANTALANEVAERRATEEQVRELLGQLVTVEEEERRRVSRELHDTVGQHLTALAIGLKTIEDMAASSSPALRPQLQKMQAIVRRLDDDVERLSHQLRPRVLDDLGLEEALSQHVRTWSEESGIPVHLHLRALRGMHLPVLAETAVFRTVQEALTNVRKHADAHEVSLIVERSGGELRVVVEDDGQGFDPEQQRPADTLGSGLGLRGMEERAKLVGGRFEVESTPGHGTTVFVVLPIRPDPG